MLRYPVTYLLGMAGGGKAGGWGGVDSWVERKQRDKGREEKDRAGKGYGGWLVCGVFPTCGTEEARRQNCCLIGLTRYAERRGAMEKCLPRFARVCAARHRPRVMIRRFKSWGQAEETLCQGYV